MKKIFIGFAIEDRFARDNLAFQAKQNHTPFEFTDMSVKNPWDSQWKTQCRQRIKGCHGMIAFISDNTLNASGALWEISCAYEERVPILLVYIHDHGVRQTPAILAGRRIVHWTWPNITNFLNSL